LNDKALEEANKLELKKILMKNSFILSRLTRIINRNLLNEVLDLIKKFSHTKIKLEDYVYCQQKNYFESNKSQLLRNHKQMKRLKS